MTVGPVTNKRTPEAGEADQVRSSLELLTLVASGNAVSTDKLYEWSAMSRCEIEEALEWAVEHTLFATKIRGSRASSETLHLTNEGRRRVILNWIVKHGAASTDHVIRRFKLPRALCYQILSDAREEGHLELAGWLNFESLLYVATRKAHRHVERTGLTVVSVSSLSEGHLRASVEEAITLEAEYGPEGKHGLYWELLSEREQLERNKGKKGEDRVGSPMYYVGKRKSYKYADLLLIRRVPGSRLITKPVEIELTAKTPEEWLAFFWAYACCKSVYELIYCCSRLVIKKVQTAREETQLRIGREVDAGNLTAESVCKLTVQALPSEMVPAERRARFYIPQPLKDGKARYREAMSCADDPAKLELLLLNTVRWVTLNGIVTPNALERWLDPREPYTALEVLTLAHGAGWLYHSDILRDEGSMFYATREGIEEVGLTPASYEVDYKADWHHTRSAALCRISRVVAELESEFPNLSVQGHWELRGDRLFSGSPLFTVAATSAGLGHLRHPSVLVMSAEEPPEYLIAAVVISAEMEDIMVKRVMKKWWESEIGEARLYIGDSKLRQAAIAAAEELRGETPNTGKALKIEELPPGSQELVPGSDEESLTSRSSPSGT